MSLAGRQDPISELEPPTAPGCDGAPGDTARRRGPRRIAYAVRATLVVAALIPVALLGGTASAAPTPTIAQLTAEINKSQQAAEQAAEKFNAAQELLHSVDVRLAAAKTRQASQQGVVDQARHSLGLIAAETYRNGDLASLSLLFSNDPDSLLAQSGLLTTLGDRQAAAVRRLLLAEQQLKSDSADLQGQQARLAKTAADLNAAKKAAQAKNSALKAQRARLTATQLAAVDSASRGSVRAGLTCKDISIQAPDARTQKVINYACAHIGDPYVYGATGPGTFDCSGLTLRAWQAAGVTLPRTAAEQAGAGSRVSLTSLRPGDLVFFYSPISHVGIYIGNGLMIHAPHTGAYVEIASARLSTAVAAARP